MRKPLVFIFTALLAITCTNKKNKSANEKDNRISLRSDTLNVVKLTDTLVIFESTCRGCAYESSTAFAIKDSLDVIKLLTVETIGNNPDGMAGGNVSKHLIIVPVKTGSTTIKMYKFWKGVPANMTDSLPFTLYSIEVQN